MLTLTEHDCECMQESELCDLRAALVKTECFLQLTKGASVHLKLLRDIMSIEQDLRVMKSIVRYSVPQSMRAGKFGSFIDWGDAKVSNALLQAIAESEDPEQQFPSAESFEKVCDMVLQSKSSKSSPSHMRNAIRHAVSQLLISVGPESDEDDDTNESEAASSCFRSLSPVLERLYFEPQWTVALLNLRSVNERRAGRRPGVLISAILTSAVSLYTTQVQDVVFDQIKGTVWADQDHMLAALATKLDYLLRSSVMEKLAFTHPTQAALDEFHLHVRPAVERAILHRLKSLHRGVRAFDTEEGQSNHPFLQAGNDIELSAFLRTEKPTGLPSILAHGCIAADDGAVVAAGRINTVGMVHFCEIGGGKKNMPTPTAREISNACLMAGRIGRTLVQDTVAWLGGSIAIAALPYRESEKDCAYFVDWVPTVQAKGGLAELNKYLRNGCNAGAGRARSEKEVQLLDVLFPRTSNDSRDLQFLEQIIYAARISEATVAASGHEAQASLALGMRKVLDRHGGSQEVFRAMEKTSVTFRLAFVRDLLDLCRQPENAALATSFACICERVIKSVEEHGHAFLLMATLDRVRQSDRVALSQAVSCLEIPRQEVFNAASADGLGGSFSVVFEVLGGGTVDRELARCSQKIQACGLTPENCVFLRMIHWLIREIEDPARFRLLEKCHHIVVLPYCKVLVAHRRQEEKGIVTMVDSYLGGLSMRSLDTGKESVWSDAHFSYRISLGVTAAFGNWASWAVADQGPEDYTCTPVTTCVMAQVCYAS